MTAYVRPSYTDLNARIAADLAAMPAVLRGPLSVAWAQACHSQHGHLEWIDKQCSPLTCELERLYDWAALYGVDRLEATAAAGHLLATGAAGTPILAGTQLRGQNGLDYTVRAAVVLNAGSTSVPVRCDSTGSAGNLLAGQTLTLIDPLPGCDSLMRVDAPGLTGGSADELVDDWRLRVAEEWQVVVTRGSRSGKMEDYRFWARSAHPSVSGALVQPHAMGVGTVLVRPICNTLTHRMPTQAVLDAVSAYLYTNAPATADWMIAAPIEHAVDVSIVLLPAADTAEHRAAIFVAVNAAVLAKSSETSVLAIGEIDAAVATVTSQYTRLAPLADIAVDDGEVLVLNPISFL